MYLVLSWRNPWGRSRHIMDFQPGSPELGILPLPLKILTQLSSYLPCSTSLVDQCDEKQISMLPWILFVSIATKLCTPPPYMGIFVVWLTGSIASEQDTIATHLLSISFYQSSNVFLKMLLSMLPSQNKSQAFAYHIVLDFNQISHNLIKSHEISLVQFLCINNIKYSQKAAKL